VEDHVAERVLQVERQVELLRGAADRHVEVETQRVLRRAGKFTVRVEHGGAAARQRDVNVDRAHVHQPHRARLKTGRNARRPWRSSGPVDSP